HAARVVHRDLKPANIMLVRQADGRDRLKVLDFGIAKVINETAVSPVSAVMGTPHYASPEQLSLGSQIDGRADNYSLGVILYEMLTGALPFNATSAHEMIRLQLSAPPPPLRKLRPDAPPALESLINRLLAKDPDERPHRSGEIPALFERALRGQDAGDDRAPAPYGDAATSSQIQRTATTAARSAEDSTQLDLDTAPEPFWSRALVMRVAMVGLILLGAM